jgi:hypothetical protein
MAANLTLDIGAGLVQISTSDCAPTVSGRLPMRPGDGWAARGSLTRPHVSLVPLGSGSADLREGDDAGGCWLIWILSTKNAQR